MKSLFDVVYAYSIIRWQSILENSKILMGLFTKSQLVIFDGFTKERCIAAYLFAKQVYRLYRKSGFLFYLKQCNSSLMIAYGGGYQGPDLFSVPVSLT